MRRAHLLRAFCLTLAGSLTLACGAESPSGTGAPEPSGQTSGTEEGVTNPMQARGDARVPDLAEKADDAPAPVRGPRLSLGKGQRRFHNFGSLLAGDVAIAHFELVSDGVADVIVERISTSCGCTGAELFVREKDGELTPCPPRLPIPPGTALVLVAELDTYFKKQDKANSNITIVANIPGRVFALSIKARLGDSLDLESNGFLSFSNLDAAGEHAREVVLSSETLKPFALTAELPADSDWLRTELIPREPDDEGRSRNWRVRVILGPGLPRGDIDQEIQLVTDQKVQGADTTYRRALTLSADVLHVLRARPRLISFGNLRPGEAAETRVQLESTDPDFQPSPEIPVRVVDGIRDLDYGALFTAHLEPGAGGDLELVLETEGLPPDFLGSFAAAVVLDVGHSEEETVTVRFAGTVTP